MAGKTYAPDADPEGLVASVKEQMARKEFIPADQQRLVFEGEELADAQTLTYNNLQKESRLYLLPKLIEEPALPVNALSNWGWFVLAMALWLTMGGYDRRWGAQAP